MIKFLDIDMERMVTKMRARNQIGTAYNIFFSDKRKRKRKMFDVFHQSSI